jgi:hypothetical protein
MLASNPPRNSRPELIADDGQGMFLSGVSYTLAPARPESGLGPGVQDGMTHRTDRFRMPQKTHSEGALIFHAVTCCWIGGGEGGISERSNSSGEQ